MIPTIHQLNIFQLVDQPHHLPMKPLDQPISTHIPIRTFLNNIIEWLSIIFHALLAPITMALFFYDNNHYVIYQFSTGTTFIFILALVFVIPCGFVIQKYWEWHFFTTQYEKTKKRSHLRKIDLTTVIRLFFGAIILSIIPTVITCLANDLFNLPWDHPTWFRIIWCFTITINNVFQFSWLTHLRKTKAKIMGIPYVTALDLDNRYKYR